jgi:hypothetical protein
MQLLAFGAVARERGLRERGDGEQRRQQQSVFHRSVLALDAGAVEEVRKMLP